MQGTAATQPPELLAYKALQAVQRGNAEELSKLIQAGANAHVINAVVKTGTSPNGRPDREAKGGLLYHAVEKENVELVKVLLGNGAEVNGSKQDESPPPLRAAVMIKSRELTSLLLKRGANVNQYYAISSGSNKVSTTVLFESTSDVIFALLLRRGGDVKAKDSNGNTPLHVHASTWNTNAVSALIDHGADVNEVAKDNQTPLLRAIQQWDPPSGCGEEQKFIDVCHTLMTHKATLPKPDLVAESPVNSERLLARLQLVKEWASQRNAGVLELTIIPVEIFRRGAAEIAAYFKYFAAHTPIPGGFETVESVDEILSVAPRRQSGVAAWSPGDEVLQRQVEILPSLERTPSIPLPNIDAVGPFSDPPKPEADRRLSRTNSTAWVPLEEAARVGQLPSLSDISTSNEAIEPLSTATLNRPLSPRPSPKSPRGSVSAANKGGTVPAKSTASEGWLGPVVSNAKPTLKPITQVQLYRLKILCAKGLRRVTKYRNQSPYCVCRLVRSDGDTFLQLQTSVHPGGGQVPTWRGQVFELALTPDDVQNCTMVFTLKHSGVMTSFDERIAVGTMPFPALSVGQSVTHKLIVMNNDKIAGRLELFMESY